MRFARVSAGRVGAILTILRFANHGARFCARFSWDHRILELRPGFGRFSNPGQLDIPTKIPADCLLVAETM
jgi:hypothetical protein